MLICGKNALEMAEKCIFQTHANEKRVAVKRLSINHLLLILSIVQQAAISQYRSGRRYIFGKYLSLNELNLCKLRWIIFVTRHKIRHICDVQCAMEPLKSYRIQHRTQMHSRCTHWDSIRSLSANRLISAASVFMRSWGNFIETENWHFM